MGLKNLVGNLTGGLIGESDAEKAAKKAGRLSEQTTQENIADFQKYFKETEADFTPYIEAGAQAITDLMDGRFGDPEIPELATFAYPNPEAPELDVFAYAVPQTPELQQFVFDATELGGTDAYKWRFEQGAQAANRAFAGDRRLGSGNRLIGMTEYGQGAASQEFENEWGRQLTANLEENRRLTDQYGLDVNRFGNERQVNLDENQRRTEEYGMDVSRFNREVGITDQENQRRMAQYGMESDRYRGIMDRITGIARQGQTAATNLGAMRQQTVGNIAGARGQNAANQFAASLIPVQEKQQFISNAMQLAGTVASGGMGGGTSMQSVKSFAGPRKL